MRGIWPPFPSEWSSKFSEDRDPKGSEAVRYLENILEKGTARAKTLRGERARHI